MGKRIQLEPAWLVSLLNQWAKHGLASELGHLGFASGSSWMRGLKSSPASCIDPTGFAARDYTDLEAGIKAMGRVRPQQLIAVMMYYKPWGVQAAIAEGHPFNNTTYYDRLHAGHRWLSDHLDTIRIARKVVAATYEACTEK